jgi:hypothetical protein
VFKHTSPIKKYPSSAPKVICIIGRDIESLRGSTGKNAPIKNANPKKSKIKL